MSPLTVNGERGEGDGNTSAEAPLGGALEYSQEFLFVVLGTHSVGCISGLCNG